MRRNNNITNILYLKSQYWSNFNDFEWKTSLSKNQIIKYWKDFMITFPLGIFRVVDKNNFWLNNIPNLRTRKSFLFLSYIYEIIKSTFSNDIDILHSISRSKLVFYWSILGFSKSSIYQHWNSIDSLRFDFEYFSTLIINDENKFLGYNWKMSRQETSISSSLLSFVTTLEEFITLALWVTACAPVQAYYFEKPDSLTRPYNENWDPLTLSKKEKEEWEFYYKRQAPWADLDNGKPKHLQWKKLFSNNNKAKTDRTLRATLDDTRQSIARTQTTIWFWWEKRNTTVSKQLKDFKRLLRYIWSDLSIKETYNCIWAYNNGEKTTIAVRGPNFYNTSINLISYSRNYKFHTLQSFEKDILKKSIDEITPSTFEQNKRLIDIFNVNKSKLIKCKSVNNRFMINSSEYENRRIVSSKLRSKTHFRHEEIHDITNISTLFTLLGYDSMSKVTQNDFDRFINLNNNARFKNHQKLRNYYYFFKKKYNLALAPLFTIEKDSLNRYRITKTSLHLVNKDIYNKANELIINLLDIETLRFFMFDNLEFISSFQKYNELISNELKKQILTQDDFMSLYKDCSYMLHKEEKQFMNDIILSLYFTEKDKNLYKYWTSFEKLVEFVWDNCLLNSTERVNKLRAEKDSYYKELITLQIGILENAILAWERQTLSKYYNKSSELVSYYNKKYNETKDPLYFLNRLDRGEQDKSVEYHISKKLYTWNAYLDIDTFYHPSIEKTIGSIIRYIKNVHSVTYGLWRVAYRFEKLFILETLDKYDKLKALKNKENNKLIYCNWNNLNRLSIFKSNQKDRLTDILNSELVNPKAHKSLNSQYINLLKTNKIPTLKDLLLNMQLLGENNMFIKESAKQYLQKFKYIDELVELSFDCHLTY